MRVMLLRSGASPELLTPVGEHCWNRGQAAGLGSQGNHEETDSEWRRGSIIFHFFSYCFTMSHGKICWEMDKERTTGKYEEVILK